MPSWVETGNDQAPLTADQTQTQEPAPRRPATMKDIAKNIICPTLITHGDKDTLMSVDGAKRLFDELGAEDKTLKIYGEADGGGRIHCSHDFWAHNLPYMLDWLEERL